MSIFRQSPFKQRSFSSNLKNTESGIKALNSTSSSFRISNHMRSTFNGTNLTLRKSSSSITKTAQGKMENLKQELDWLFKEISDVRNSTKSARQNLKFIKQEYEVRRLPIINQELNNKIAELKRQIGISIRSDKLRYDGIWQIVANNQRNTRQITKDLFQLKNAIAKVQNSLGFYSGAEKHHL